MNQVSPLGALPLGLLAEERGRQPDIPLLLSVSLCHPVSLNLAFLTGSSG